MSILPPTTFKASVNQCPLFNIVSDMRAVTNDNNIYHSTKQALKGNIPRFSTATGSSIDTSTLSHGGCKQMTATDHSTVRTEQYRKYWHVVTADVCLADIICHACPIATNLLPSPTQCRHYGHSSRALVTGSAGLLCRTFSVGENRLVYMAWTWLSKSTFANPLYLQGLHLVSGATTASAHIELFRKDSCLKALILIMLTGFFVYHSNSYTVPMKKAPNVLFITRLRSPLYLYVGKQLVKEDLQYSIEFWLEQKVPLFCKQQKKSS